jgi:glycine oxidase
MVAGVNIQIKGAGVMGLVMATELTQRGHKVEMIDPAEKLGPHACSWWAGGMLAPFCEGESAEEAVECHGIPAIDWWERHSGSVVRNGTLVMALARDKSEITRFSRRSRGGHPVHGQEISKLEPYLSERFDRGLFYPDEAHLAPRQALFRLREQLLAKGVIFHTEAPPTDADMEIDARGLAARDVLHDLRGVRGEMLLLRCPEMSLSRPVRLLHPRIPLYIVPRGDGVFMLGATMIESNQRCGPSARSLLELLSAAYALHPAFGEAEVLEIGADARPAFPDNLPKLRRKGRTIFANGLYRHGFLLSPAVATMAADYLDSGIPPEFMDEDVA